MKDPDLLQALEGVYMLEYRSIVRYVHEAANPVVGDEWGQRAKAALEEWYTDTRAHLAAIEQLFTEEDYSPAPSQWLLTHSEFNFLTYAHIVRSLPERHEPAVAEMEEHLARLAAWPAAQAVVRELIKSERAHLRACEALLAERPAVGPPDAPRRQVSANFW
jgi:hypothetical protein